MKLSSGSEDENKINLSSDAKLNFRLSIPLSNNFQESKSIGFGITKTGFDLKIRLFFIQFASQLLGATIIILELKYWKS